MTQKTFSEKEKSFLCKEIENLLQKKVIAKYSAEPGEYLPPIFLVPKDEDACRLILNLKSLNRFIRYQHFKMDTMHTVISLIQKDFYMVSLDIKGAYYSVPILAAHRRYLKFEFNGVYSSLLLC